MSDFEEKLTKHFEDFFKLVATEDGDWTVKGFIDVYKNIYTISLDTKVVSKIIELMIFPVISTFAEENNYKFALSMHQNHYPDITFIDKASGEKIAVDLKSTYRITDNTVNGMTLGAFTGYFRVRNSHKNVTYPYEEYSKHYVLGVIYSKSNVVKATKVLEDLGVVINSGIRKKISEFLSKSTDECLEDLLSSIRATGKDFDENTVKQTLLECLSEEQRKYTLNDLKNITSVVRDFDFFLQEKWKIAIDRPGSGNTKNIGSTTKIDELRNGQGIFTKHKKGEKLFNDYWMTYLTLDMARAAELPKPLYHNLDTYFDHKGINSYD